MGDDDDPFNHRAADRFDPKTKRIEDNNKRSVWRTGWRKPNRRPCLMRMRLIDDAVYKEGSMRLIDNMRLIARCA